MAVALAAGGAHTLVVAAGNWAPGANDLQKRGAKNIYVQVKVSAKEKLGFKLEGQIDVDACRNGHPCTGYQLRPKGLNLGAGKSQVLKLRLKKDGAKRRVREALRAERTITAKVRVSVAGSAGVPAERQVPVRLVGA